MRKGQFDEHVAMGHLNARTIELVRRHCQHGRVEFVSGNSPVGEALGLPMGMLQIRCKHAPPPTWSGHNALELATEFYRANCVDCPYREASGDLPNLATVVAEQDKEHAKLREKEKRLAIERASRHQARREQRRLAVATEGYVIKELAEWLDHLDAPAPRTSDLSGDPEQASRQIVETARHAPELFSPTLVDTLLGLAADTAEATAFVALAVLVDAQRCAARALVEGCIAALTVRSEPEAAKLLSRFRDDLRAADLGPVLDRLIHMAAVQSGPWDSPAVTDGLTAAAAVDLPAVTARIIELLMSEDETTRGAAADAAACLLVEDASRVIALGAALVASIHGEDEGFSGSPHPNTSAMKALAEAWRGEPLTTMSIVENAAAANEEAKPHLLRVSRFIQHWREPWEANEDAGKAAVEFCLRHLGGDWGEEAATEASYELEHLAREVPHLLTPRVDSLMGMILGLTAPTNTSPLLADQAPPNELAALELATLRIGRSARLRRIAETLGRIARVDPGSTLPRLLPLFETELGDETQSMEVRLAILDALEAAACPDLLRDLLPIAYTALLSAEPLLRAAGIDLWAACAGAAAGALPGELTELAPTILADEFVVVHRRMLKRLRGLHLPDHLAASLVGLVAGWAQTYIGKPDILDDALWSLRYLASKLDDEVAAGQWKRLALELSGKLSPYDRRQFLAVEWPDQLLRAPVWARTVVSTLACPELVDYFNQRHDSLLARLMDRPALLVPVPLDEVMAMSGVHKAQFFRQSVWQALEPVELLQAAGRWSDAAKLADRVAQRQPPGRDAQYARLLAEVICSSARHTQDSIGGTASPAALTATALVVRQAVDAFTSAEPEIAGGAASQLIETALAPIAAIEALLAWNAGDSSTAPTRLSEAAEMLDSAAGDAYASAMQRRALARAWRIAVALMKYDDAVRKADPAADRFLVAAKREADVAGKWISSQADVPSTSALMEFLALVESMTAANEVSGACQVLLAAVAPLHLIRALEPTRPNNLATPTPDEPAPDPLLAVCVAEVQGAPVTDVLVVRPNEIYSLGVTVWLSSWPDWAEQCIVEPVSRISRDALTLPKFVFSAENAQAGETGILLEAEDKLFCRVEQPVGAPSIDCPLLVRLCGNGKEEAIEVAGYRRLRLRPFDPSKDALTQHKQMDQRLLTMFERVARVEYDTEDVRAFCRLFSSSVRAAQSIMFEKIYRRGTKVTEAVFHDEFERRLREDPELGGRLTRRDAVAGGFDDLLHDEVIAELKVARDGAITVDDCARYIGQPAQYGVGRGSQLSVLVVLDHSGKEAPPGVLENYIGWLQPQLHGLTDPAYPSLVGVLIVNTNLPVPSAWSRRKIVVV